MNIKRFSLMVSLIFLSACVTVPPAKTGRSVESQHERARSAFDELDDKPAKPSSRPAPVKPRPSEDETSIPPSKPEVSRPDIPPPPKDFSSSRFLTAKGYGQSKPESINNAKAELSNIFEAKISSDVTTRVKAVTDSVKGDSFNKSIQSQINVISNIELEGVQVGEPQREKGEFVTVAALDKAIAQEKWKGDIQKIDTEMDVLITKSNRASSKIQKLLPLKKSLELWVKREVTVSRLRVIGSDAEKRDLKDILMAISDLKSSMLIDIDVAGASGPSVRDTVAKILTNNGFKIGEYNSKADVDVKGSIKIDTLDLNNPRFKFSRATVSLNIMDAATGSQVGQIAENYRGAGINNDEAAHKAVKKVSELISEKLIQYFN